MTSKELQNVEMQMSWNGGQEGYVGIVSRKGIWAEANSGRAGRMGR